MKKLGCVAVLFGLVIFALSQPGRSALSYVLDFKPPQVEVNLEQAKFGATVSIPFVLSDAHAVHLRYRFDEDAGGEKGIDEPKSPLVVDASGLKDGEHVLHLRFVDTSAWKHSTEVDVPLHLDLRPPKASLLSPERIWESRQGDTLLVFARVDKPVVRCEIEDVGGTGGEAERLPGAFFEAAPQVYCVLRPIDIETPPGEYSDRILFYDQAGNSAELTQRIKVLKKPLADGTVQLTDTILQKIHCKDLDEEEALRKMNNARIAQIASRITEERVFRGAFVRPAQGKWTSPYGQNRRYNGKVWHRHLGMDLADVSGAQVFATNDGVVVVAEPLGIYGNCVILDHGRGIYSLYGHNSVLKVRAGDRVEKGQSIAIQGNTGLAEGIHLHLSFIVGTVYVAPDIFIQKFEGFEQALAHALGEPTPGAVSVPPRPTPTSPPKSP
jgi:murein DD-endopeptidase MepM/ murein hydrolase activator NlpD